jgi:hypothetical protein
MLDVGLDPIRYIVTDDSICTRSLQLDLPLNLKPQIQYVFDAQALAGRPTDSRLTSMDYIGKWAQ